jgi:hypothetical protein
MTEMVTIHRRIRFGSSRRGQQLNEEHTSPAGTHGRIPRVARLMALAIRLEALMASGQVPNSAALAELAHLSRARITQITNLTLLAPDIQEALLFLPPVEQGRDPVTERDLRPIVAEPDWARQREQWAPVRERAVPPPRGSS